MFGPEAIRTETLALRAATARPFNLNFFCHRPPTGDAERETAWQRLLSPYYREWNLTADTPAAAPSRKAFDAEAAELVEALRPAVVSFHFGLPPAALLSRIKQSGAFVLSSATTVDEALWLEANGADAVIAQGLEAGGHRGWFLSDDVSRQCGLFALLPQVVDAVRIPVIASGGIADARGVAAALALGAAAVQVGTAYLLCPEAATRPVHRAALASAEASHTALTTLFSGGLARGIVNRAMRELGPVNAATPPFPLAASAMTPLRSAAEAEGLGDFSPLWAGQNTTGCKTMPAGELTRALAGAA
jgi:nitronate monooxygenase